VAEGFARFLNFSVLEFRALSWGGEAFLGDRLALSPKGAQMGA